MLSKTHFLQKWLIFFFNRRTVSVLNIWFIMRWLDGVTNWTGHESKQTLKASEGQWSLVGYSPRASQKGRHNVATEQQPENCGSLYCLFCTPSQSPRKGFLLDSRCQERCGLFLNPGIDFLHGKGQSRWSSLLSLLGELRVSFVAQSTIWTTSEGTVCIH